MRADEARSAELGERIDQVAALLGQTADDRVVRPAQAALRTGLGPVAESAAPRPEAQGTEAPDRITEQWPGDGRPGPG